MGLLLKGDEYNWFTIFQGNNWLLYTSKAFQNMSSIETSGQELSLFHGMSSVGQPKDKAAKGHSHGTSC